MKEQWNLNQLIEAIEKQLPYIDEECSIKFDFEHAYPTRLMSWRGDYWHLAIGFDFINIPPLVDYFLQQLKAAIGQTFEGYKGGLFIMSPQTRVWVSNYGNAGHTGIVGVINEKYQLILETQYCEY